MVAQRALTGFVALLAIASGPIDLRAATATAPDDVNFMQDKSPNQYYFDTSDVEMVSATNNYGTPTNNVSIDNRSGKLYGYDDYMGALDTGYPNEGGSDDYDYGELIYAFGLCGRLPIAADNIGQHREEGHTRFQRRPIVMSPPLRGAWPAEKFHSHFFHQAKKMRIRVNDTEQRRSQEKKIGPILAIVLVVLLYCMLDNI